MSVSGAAGLRIPAISPDGKFMLALGNGGGSNYGEMRIISYSGGAWSVPGSGATSWFGISYANSIYSLITLAADGTIAAGGNQSGFFIYP